MYDVFYIKHTSPRCKCLNLVTILFPHVFTFLISTSHLLFIFHVPPLCSTFFLPKREHSVLISKFSWLRIRMSLFCNLCKLSLLSISYSLFDLLSCGVWASGSRSAIREAVFGAWEGNHSTHCFPLWLSLKVAGYLHGSSTCPKNLLSLSKSLESRQLSRQFYFNVCTFQWQQSNSQKCLLE